MIQHAIRLASVSRQEDWTISTTKFALASIVIIARPFLRCENSTRHVLGDYLSEGILTIALTKICQNISISKMSISISKLL